MPRSRPDMLDRHHILGERRRQREHRVLPRTCRGSAPSSVRSGCWPCSAEAEKHALLRSEFEARTGGTWRSTSGRSTLPSTGWAATARRSQPAAGCRRPHRVPAHPGRARRARHPVDAPPSTCSNTPRDDADHQARPGRDRAPTSTSSGSRADPAHRSPCATCTDLHRAQARVDAPLPGGAGLVAADAAHRLGALAEPRPTGEQRPGSGCWSSRTSSSPPRPRSLARRRRDDAAADRRARHPGPLLPPHTARPPAPRPGTSRPLSAAATREPLMTEAPHVVITDVT